MLTHCPNCGAPRTSEVCGFCNVILEPGGKPAAASKSASAVVAALRAGNKIEAIRLYREQTGLGLRESKDAVDKLERELGL
ncbi:MAG: ribosomal protein L7/L12 [Sandaracinaceae bacterium]|nr:ribosomal protein L7/L12 [Sandaracinaceae bacterium]